MAELAVADEDSGELDEAQVVGGLLVPADAQAAEAVAPAVRHLDHPAPWRMAVGWPGGGSGCAALALGGMCGV